MATTNTSADEQLKLERAPVDRLLFGCVLGASAAYVAFLVVMQFMPRAAEDVAKQGYLGVVSGESQPNGGGAGEQDPAPGTAEQNGRGSAYYAGNGQAPRPVVLVEGSAQHPRGDTPRQQPPPARVRLPTTSPQAGGGLSQRRPASPGKLGLGELMFAQVHTLAELELGQVRGRAW